MENVEISSLLREFADLLEISGANPFRVRAYRNAVRTIAGLTRSIESMVEGDEDLRALPDIGKDLAQYLTEIVRTGTFDRLEEVAQQVPRSLATLVRLDGVGPKKAKKLWEELDVADVDALEAAAKDGRVEVLDGFGKRSVEKILVSIGEYRTHQGRYLISEAEQLIQGVIEHLRELSEVEKLEVAGSLRRRRETIGDVDLLVQSDHGAKVIEHFTQYRGAERVDGAGDTKGTLVLRSGLQVDLRVIPAESWGAAMHYFTGSKEHNVKVRQRAQRMGLRVNEWGVFKVPEGDEAEDGEWGEKVAGETEEDVFQAVGLPWIAPELRENRGEIEGGLDGTLPQLIEMSDLRGDLHMHSTWSDGQQSLREMTEACRDRGYEYLMITDHSQSLSMVQGLTPERARQQWLEIDSIREEVEEIHLFRSAEVDILKDGSLDLPDDILDEMDVVLVSIHSFMDLDQAEMTKRVLRAISHPAVDILGHPTGRIINRRNAYALDVEAVLQAASEHDVAVELNSNPRRLDLSDVHVRRAKELGVKVVVSTDAHSIKALGLMRFGIEQARRAWLEPGDVLNALPLDEFGAWVRRRTV